MTKTIDNAQDFAIRMVSGSPWEIAKDLGIHYTGDMSPIPHGGMFYNSHNWDRYGYADCVSIYELDGKIFIECGTINKSDDLTNALACIGQSADTADILVQIEACESYDGYEVLQDFSGDYRKSYPYDRNNDPSQPLEDGTMVEDIDNVNDPNFDCYWSESPVWADVWGWISGLQE